MTASAGIATIAPRIRFPVETWPRPGNRNDSSAAPLGVRSHDRNPILLDPHQCRRRRNPCANLKGNGHTLL